MEHDISEIAALLHIHREAVSHGPVMNNIAAATYNRLMQVNASMGEQLAKEKAAAEEEAKAKAEQDAADLAAAQEEAAQAQAPPHDPSIVRRNISQPAEA
jgi:hypothetical protein